MGIDPFNVKGVLGMGHVPDFVIPDVWSNDFRHRCKKRLVAARIAII